MSLSREQILAAQDLPIKTVPMPAWGGEVLVRKLSASERVRWTAKYEGEVKGERAVKFLCELLVMSLCDEAGKSIMDEADVAALAEKDFNALDSLSAIALEMNGISKDAIADAKKN